MTKGGGARDEQTTLLMRLAGFVLPIIAIANGFLIRQGIISREHYAGDLTFLIISGLFILIGTYAFLFPPKNRIEVAFRLYTFQVLAVAYIVFISGFVTPFVICWVVMFYDTHRWLGYKGLAVSGMLFLSSFVISALQSTDLDRDLVANIIVSIGVIVATAVILAVIRVQLVRQDVLEQSRAQEALYKDRTVTLMNNLSEGIISIDEQGIVQIYNAATLNILDTNRDLHNHHIDEVLVVKNEAGRRVHLIDYTKGMTNMSMHDDLYYSYNDETIRLEMTITPIQGGHTETEKLGLDGGFMIILRDVTHQKNLEDERDEFISVVSHELRTPLSIAEGTLSNLEKTMGKGIINQKKAQDSLEAAHEQILYLSKIVNDLSTLSRAERGIGDAPEDINVHELLEGLYKEYAPQAKKKGISFDIDAPAALGTVRVSRLYLNELMQNFVTNALKYTREGSITLRAKKTGERITLAVKDTGIGISKSEYEKIYDKFYRSEDYRTRETRGTGLGLYVAAKLARKINTYIKLESRLNHGSTFSIDLPLKKKTD